MNFKIFNLKKSFVKKDYNYNIALYWRIIVFVFFVVIIISFIYGFLVFTEINKDSGSPEVNNVDKASQNRKDRIDKVLESFSQKEQKTNAIINSPSPVVDPSL